MQFDELYELAKSVINPRKISECAEAGEVGAAILTKSGMYVLAFVLILGVVWAFVPNMLLLQ